MRNQSSQKPTRLVTAGLSLGAVGVVFGDIGTSPLYALPAVFGIHGLHLPVSELNVLGVISLIIWSIILVVSVKYIAYIMRAHNHGEGGIMALVAHIKNDHVPERDHSKLSAARRARRRWLYIFLGLAGVALFYGNSTITPAISVLSAVEGLRNISPQLGVIVIPATLALLALLFYVQQYGTSAIGKFFGPVMALWFLAIGIAGGYQVFMNPAAFAALSPMAAWAFLLHQPLVAFIALSAVILAVAGAEALYADMGHFGRGPIARAWFFLVFPALILCYLGQGALILDSMSEGKSGSVSSSPLMELFPAVFAIPFVVLATVAALIASQAVISGAFSLTKQAIQLGFLPRMRVVHTSDREAGQIYLPYVNLLLFMGVTLLILIFGTSAKLANAYGIAVSGTLAIDTILFLIVARSLLKLPAVTLAVFGAVFITLDLAFVAANVSKVLSGGWFPLVVSLGALVVILTWIRGHQIILSHHRAAEGSLQKYITKVRHMKPPITRVPGVAVYVGSHAGLAPHALHSAVEKLHELHKRVIIMTVQVTNHAHVPEEERASIDGLTYDDGITEVVLRYGYHDRIDIPRTLSMLRGRSPELDFDPDEVSYFVSLTHVVAGTKPTMSPWRKSLYTFLDRNAISASDYFRLPPDRTVEMRAVVEL
jgi:KUP system potassium uptake protein